MDQSASPKLSIIANGRNIRLEHGTVSRFLHSRTGCVEWEVVTVTGVRRAIQYPELTPDVQMGDAVLLNITASELSLGTGGVDFIVACVSAAERAARPAGRQEDREAGHLLRLRYTPLQHRVFCVDDPASPHYEAMRSAVELHGTPVVCTELHSQAAAVLLELRRRLPGQALAYVQLDSAALPLPFSRLMGLLREHGVVSATVSCGQGWGGDVEAVSLPSALIATRAVLKADAVVVSQGPGNMGGGTRFGFSGVSVVEALHTADALGGIPVYSPRVSDADPRPRHLGISHHTASILALLRVPVEVPCRAQDTAELEQLPVSRPHRYRGFSSRFSDEIPSLLAPHLKSMGRSPSEDRALFDTAAAAAECASTYVSGFRSEPDADPPGANS